MPDTVICSPPRTIIGELLIEQEKGSITALRSLRSENQNSRSLEDKDINGAQTTDNEMLARACRQLREYFSGWRREFSLPLAPRGSNFQRRVWEELQKIPPGETRTSDQIAEDLGKPGGSRVVSNACSTNPIMIIIPCHRVIRADGKHSGYGEDQKLKEKLLKLEKKNYSAS